MPAFLVGAHSCPHTANSYSHSIYEDPSSGMETKLLILKDSSIRSMGISRALGQADAPIVQRLPQLKFRIDRGQILPSAQQVLEHCRANRVGVLNVEFFNEPGIGSGPTREFYTLFSEEIQLRNLNIWLESETKPSGFSYRYSFSPFIAQVGDREFVFHESGLFPRPAMPWHAGYDQIETICNNMKLLGRFIAKALFDDQLVDIPLSIPFLKLTLGYQLDVMDLKALRPGMGDFISKASTLYLQHTTSMVPTLCPPFHLPC